MDQLLEKRVFMDSSSGSENADNFIRKVVVPDWPKIIVVADGSHGETCSVGLSPDYMVESCNAYGANATTTRLDQRQSKKHSFVSPDDGFPEAETQVLKSLTVSLKIVKIIFHQAFNAYKMDIEPRVRDAAMSRVQCSRRLFKIMLSHRRATTAYNQGEGRVVMVEGEAAQYSILTQRSPSPGTITCGHLVGSGLNLGLQGLESLEEFICKIATAIDQSDILETLAVKIRHSKQVVEDFKQNGFITTIFK
ncbi:hypothetical protein VULLAG_LOCUS20826 [Vulpes lagopus]